MTGGIPWLPYVFVYQKKLLDGRITRMHGLEEEVGELTGQMAGTIIFVIHSHQFVAPLMNIHMSDGMGRADLDKD